MNFNDSETRKNLVTALQGEALAHLKYQFYRSKLVELNKGYENILDEIIHNEKEHGKIWFKLLHDGVVPDDITNLLDAIKGETYEANEMYQEFGRTAKDEGFYAIADLFFDVANIESHHANKFSEIKNEVESHSYSESESVVSWKCLNCGHIVDRSNAPDECPVCKHPMKYFVRL